ncbi:MAG: protoheme IX farnesyltransferase [Planctomycetes bacterium]|nr:protoheme IX farnesyltransferase [Planctomycetota bacterium]
MKARVELAVARPRAEVLADFLVLVRPRISAFVLFAAFTGALLGAGPDAALPTVALAALFVGLVGASSSVFNQVVERDTDRLMPRTATRPLATGRMSVRDAVLFGAVLGLTGVAGLAFCFQPLSALLALSTLAVYVLVYTPLKRFTSLNTVVGALPGAMPPLLGFVALAGRPGPWGWLLFAIVFAWQFPHFFAIAWLYQDQYRRAGMRMLPCLPGARGLAGRQALAYSLLLLPVSLLPGVRGQAGIVYVAAALMLGLAYVASSACFARRESRATARALVVVSLFYLPLLFSAVLFDPVVSRVLRN